MIDYYKITKDNLVMDPFGGCGTTPLACSLQGIGSISIELNPFMNFVSKVKVKSLSLDVTKLRTLSFELRNKINQNKNKNSTIPTFLFKKKFFNESNIKQASIIKKSINELCCHQEYKDFFLLMISSLIVRISNMKRAVDLRYKEIPTRKLDVYKMFFHKANKSIDDLKKLKIKPVYFDNINTDIINGLEDFKKYFGRIDYFITSPPYLNGTNYVRNTKLELSFLDFIKDENDIKELRKKMVIAGINSIQTDNIYDFELNFIEPLINKVEKNAYDTRIPKMVKGYFYDMYLALKNISNLLNAKGKGVIVVGDSQFGGVHIETDIILGKICEMHNLKVESIDIVRTRKSKNGMKLRESLIFVKK
jgi:hypothetical protein